MDELRLVVGTESTGEIRFDEATVLPKNLRAIGSTSVDGVTKN